MPDYTAADRQAEMRKRDRKKGIEYVQFRCDSAVMDVIRARARTRNKSLAGYLRGLLKLAAISIQRQDQAQSSLLEAQSVPAPPNSNPQISDAERKRQVLTGILQALKQPR